MKKHKVKKPEETEEEEKVEEAEEKDEVEEVEETSDSEMPKLNQDADEDVEEEKDEDEGKNEEEVEDIKPDEVVESVPPVVEAEQCTRLNPKVKMYLGIGLAGAVILGVAIGLLIYYFVGIKTEVLEPSARIPVITDVVENSVNSVIPQAPGSVEITNLSSSYVGAIKVKWQTQVEQIDVVEADKILKQVDPNGKYYEGVKKAEGWTVKSKPPAGFGVDHLALFKAGTVTSPASLANRQLYYWFMPVLPVEMGTSYNIFLVFVDDNNKLIKIVGDAKDSQSDIYQLLSGYIVSPFPELVPPPSLSMPVSDVSLAYVGWADENIFSDYYPYGNVLGLRQLYPFADGLIRSANANPKDYGTVSLGETDKVFTTEQGIDVYYKDSCYRVLMPNGAQAVYDLVIPFFVGKKDAGFLTNIVWQKEDNSKERYEAYKTIGSCGSRGQCNLNVGKEEWFDAKKLVEIGKTTDGQSVYELSDKATNSFYQTIFTTEIVYAEVIAKDSDELSKEQKLQKFLDDQPLFFWQDSFGHWLAFKKAKYQAMAECGKPVIYLYPEKEMDVKVTVAPNGGFKITEPEYGANGWTVRATPQSDLFNYADKTTYPYLFWEGHAYNMSMPTEGFVMKKSDVGTKMNIILSKLGLNAKEIKDFMEFWQPKLEVKPYVFVTFISQTEFDKLAPLTVTPAPDKVIRVFMDYAPLDQPVYVRPMKITTPVRTGFTVVEWGGRLHN